MIFLLGEVSNGSKKLELARAEGWGRMFVERPLRPLEGEPWALDNGAFRAWNAGEPYAPYYERFMAKLEHAAEIAAAGEPPLLVVAPDEPAAGLDSLWVTLEWLEAWEQERQAELDPIGWHYGTRHGLLPVFVAVQDGMTPEDLEALDPETGRPWIERFAGVFLGGTNEWKARTAEAWAELARSYGLRFHYARAGTAAKIDHARDVGADSADSAFPCFLAGERWDRFVHHWRHGPDQLRLAV